MRVIKKVMLFTILLIFPFVKVFADSINKIYMDVYINNNGNATVTERWETDFNSDTEFFKAYNNLGNSSIINFSVTDESGRLYEKIPEWDVNASFEEKAYKYGIRNTSDGIELCWGKSEYGERTYMLQYEIVNLVMQYTDAQGLYFNFLNLDQTVQVATINIHSDMQFSSANSKIWSFGNNGNISFIDGI